jgi:CheY-like chemotaxis protein
VVDDDPDLLDLLKVALTMLRSHDVVVASSARVALNMLAEPHQQFDAFLLDIQMPGMSGVEFLTALRRMQRYAKTPVLMLTAMSDRENLEAAFHAGAQDYVTKPFDYNNLFARMDSVCEPARLGLEHTTGHDGVMDNLNTWGIERMIGKLEFRNYVSQIWANQLLDAKLLAIKLVRPVGDHSNESLLPQLISDTTAGESCLLSQYDRDICLVLVHEESITRVRLSEKALNRELSALSGTEGYRIAVGRPIDLVSHDNLEIQDPIGVAVDQVEESASILRPRPATLPALRSVSAQKKASLENMFETVLCEFQGSRTYLLVRR